MVMIQRSRVFLNFTSAFRKATCVFEQHFVAALSGPAHTHKHTLGEFDAGKHSYRTHQRRAFTDRLHSSNTVGMVTALTSHKQLPSKEEQISGVIS